MKICSWNVNSISTIKTWHPWSDSCKFPSFKDILNDLKCGMHWSALMNPLDIICVQEVKSTKEKLSQDYHTLKDYFAFYALHPTDGYAGVATFVKKSICPLHCQPGFSGLSFPVDAIGGVDELYASMDKKELLKLDSEGRCIITDHGRFVLFNVYFPCESEHDHRQLFKEKFSRAVQLRVDSLINAGRSVILVGDVNVAHLPIDHFDPCLSVKELGIENYADWPSRRWFDEWLNTSKLVDTYRHLNPTKPNVYTVWNTRENKRATNQGTRIDYILISQDLYPFLEASDIDMTVMGSDHAPIFSSFFDVHPETNEPFLPLDQIPTKPPQGCTFYWKSFGDKQKRLDSFLVKRSTGEFDAKNHLSLGSRLLAASSVTNSVVKSTKPTKPVKKKKASSSKPVPKQANLASFLKRDPKL